MINEEISKNFEKLKQIFQFPRFYLSEYFTNLKTEVDLAFSLAEQQADDKTEFKKNWVDMIQKIENFEQDCFRKKKTNVFNDVISDQVKFIELNLNDFNLDIQSLIDETIYKIEKELFLNKTLTFLDESKCQTDILQNFNTDNNTVGKLVFINNEYFDLNDLELIKNNTCQKNMLTSRILLLQKFLKIAQEEYLTNNNSIDEIKLDLNDSITHIYFNSYELDRIDCNAFKSFNNLILINLSNNQIKTIGSSLFKYTANLSIIDLSNNLLTAIPANLFNGLSKLKKIYLSYNKLKYLDEYLFSGLKLILLDLSNNQIENFQANVFSNLILLENLWLEENFLKNLRPGLFNGLNNLNVMDLSANQIENLDECAFKDLNNLIDLNLSKNKLNEIHLNLFKGLNELTYIDISNNELKQIDSDVFKGLNKLNSVKLNNNHLQSINKLRFSKLPIIW